MPIISRWNEWPFCALQSVGARQEQEDSYGLCYRHGGSDPNDPICFILADGMGGHVGGSVASQTAVDAVKLIVSETSLSERIDLMHGLSVANASLAECLAVNPELDGMGTTLVIAAIQDAQLSWLSVGDSPMFGLTEEFAIKRLNEDHSMKPVLDSLVDAGNLDVDSDEYRKKANQLRSAVLGEEVNLYEINDKGISLNDWRYIIIASDGLETLSPEEISKCARLSYRNGCSGIALGLIDAVDLKKNSNQDNTTILVHDKNYYVDAQNLK